MSSQEKVIRVGSRKSELALIQTKHVIGRLQKLYPKQKFEIHTMSTFGDRVLNVSLPKIGEKSLFTRDLEDALRNGGVDFVVHSLKDLPTALPTGMAIGAVLEREDARDALVLRENFKGHTIASLPKGSVIGTSSLRRTAQIRRMYPHLTVCDIRGNLNTRLAKLDAADSKFSGIILAQAGLVRMGWMSRISQVLEPADLLYAVGQGALAVECRANDDQVLAMLQKLMCLNTTCRILAERSFLKTLGGGCSAPVAVWSILKGEPLNGNSQEVGLSLTGAVWSLDGAIEIRNHLACALNEEKSEVEQRKRGAQESSSQPQEENSNSCDSPPATKRARNGNVSSGSGSDSNSSSPRQQGSPPVICEDIAACEALSGYSVEQLTNLASQCPVLSNSSALGSSGIGGGDADTSNTNTTARQCPLRLVAGQDVMGQCPVALNQAKAPAKCPVAHAASGDSSNKNNGNGNEAANTAHCPLQMPVGQDFMGECPYVNKETKISYAQAGKCPVTGGLAGPPTSILPTPPSSRASNASSIGDDVDNVATSSKCPFSAMHHGSGLEALNKDNGNTAQAKCPFLQKTVQMFDYADEEQPTPQHSVLIEDVQNLFCGLYQHACHSRGIYEKANQLGKTLAEELIKRGALDVMKVAQAEIHGKVTS
ncbi:porphobilinogen deaminase [Drosophila rhopaloa]|uniref:hydroxymethylbilane synthase n=1 Tax=Drosophila rhopaloa TaxID=1041015 RepID=A0ABM5HQY1_DRORH|nr:porphobilinogen deaminase [Drosophila rhopaloa]